MPGSVGSNLPLVTLNTKIQEKLRTKKLAIKSIEAILTGWATVLYVDHTHIVVD